MIITRTPLRMSFVGGGSDMPLFYKHSPGAVISSSINKYIYVMLQKKFDENIRISYAQNELVKNRQKIKHPIIKNILNYYKVDQGLEIVSVADIPSKGSGLGSSSSFTVGMLNAINKFLETEISKFNLGKLAAYVEIEMCGEPIGKQDQFAAAVGGLNYIQFNEDDSVQILPIKIEKENLLNLQNQILLLFTGKTRSASKILKLQNQNLLNNNTILITKKMVELTNFFKKSLETFDIDAINQILNENWELKKSLASNISNLEIDEMILKSKKLGANSAKILGAGNGGFLMLIAPQEKHLNIVKNLGLKHVPIKFDNVGTINVESSNIFDKN